MCCSRPPRSPTSSASSTSRPTRCTVSRPTTYVSTVPTPVHHVAVLYSNIMPHPYLQSNRMNDESHIESSSNLAGQRVGRERARAHQPLRRLQGCCRVRRQVVLPLVRLAGHHHARQQRLWTAPVSREAHPQVHQSPLPLAQVVRSRALPVVARSALSLARALAHCW